MTAPKQDTFGWDFWKAARKGKKIDVPLGIVPIGYYRKQTRSTGVWYPVAIWVGTDGVKRAQIGHAEVKILATAEEEERFDFEVFSYASKTPTSHPEYQHWMQHREWPEAMGLKPIVKTVAAPREAKIGDNSGATAGEIEAMTLEALKDQVDSAIEQSKQFAKVETKEQGNAAQGLRTRLTSLASMGDKQRDIEKRPHLEAGRAVDDAWNPLIKAAKEAARVIKTAVDDQATREKRRIAAERAEQQAAGNAPTEAAEPITFQGNQGGKTTARTIIVPTIVDYDAVYEQLRKNPEVTGVLDTLVAKIYRNYGPGMPDMKGVKSEERASVR